MTITDADSTLSHHPPHTTFILQPPSATHNTQNPARLVVLLPVVVLLLHEEVLVRAVARESDGRDAQAGERVLEAVEAGEAACVAPCLAGVSVLVNNPLLVIGLVDCDVGGRRGAVEGRGVRGFEARGVRGRGNSRLW